MKSKVDGPIKPAGNHRCRFWQTERASLKIRGDPI